MSLWQKGKKAFNSFFSGNSQTCWEVALASAAFSSPGLEGPSALSPCHQFQGRVHANEVGRIY